MKKNNLLITINQIEDIDKLKKLGVSNYAFPLKEFCVGIPNTFLISEIPKEYNSFLFMNRVLDNEGIDKLKSILNNLPSNIKGIIFDDLGILNIVKDLKIEKILYLNHFNSNVLSIKEYLKYVDSVVVSTDINKSELEYILKEIPNKLTVCVLGYLQAMYSRRILLDNYCTYYNLKKENGLVITSNNEKFFVYENEYGTVLYHLPCYSAMHLDITNSKYNFINSAFLNIDDITKFIKGNNPRKTDTGFLDTSLIYKLKGENND